MKAKSLIDIYVGIGLFIFSVAVHTFALQFTSMEDVMGVGAEVFPRVFARALMVLAVLLVVTSFWRPPFATPSFASLPRVLCLAAVCYAFVYFMPIVGYAVLSPIFAMIATIIATRRIRLWDQVPVLGIVFAIYLIFSLLLKVPLPTGTWG